MQLVITAVALKHLGALPKADGSRLVVALQDIAAAHPSRMSYVTELAARPGFWRARKGDYRAIYEIYGDTMTVHAVGHRKDIYE